MTKTEIINKITAINPKYKQNLGKLHYMTKDKLKKLLLEEERKKRC